RRGQEVPRRNPQIGDDRIQMSAAAGLPLALTIGEPAGIGPDLTLAVWRRRVELDVPAFYLIGEPDFLRHRARALGLDVPCAIVAPEEAGLAFERALPVVPLNLPVTAAPGKQDASSAPAAIASIRRAVADVLAGHAAAVVTNPVAKNVLYRSGFAEPGHTEFLAKGGRGSAGKAGAAGDDAVVGGARRGAGDHPSAAARRGVAPHHATHCGYRAHRRARSGVALRYRPPAHRGRRAQSACRRGGRAR